MGKICWCVDLYIVVTFVRHVVDKILHYIKIL